MSYKAIKCKTVSSVIKGDKKRKIKNTCESHKNIRFNTANLEETSNQSTKMTLCNYEYEDSKILIDPSSILSYLVDKNNRIVINDERGKKCGVKKDLTTREVISCPEVSHTVSTDTLSIGTQNVPEFEKMNCNKSLETQANFMPSVNNVLLNETNHVGELQSYKKNYRRSAKLKHCFCEEQEFSRLTQGSFLSHSEHNSTKCDEKKEESYAVPVKDQERELDIISNDMHLSQKKTTDFQGDQNEGDHEVDSKESAQPVCDKNEMATSLMYSLRKSNTWVYQTEDVPSSLSVVTHSTSTFNAVIDKENQFGEKLFENNRITQSEHWKIVLKRKSYELKEGEVCQGNVKKSKIAPIKLVKNRCCSVPSKKSVEAGKNDSCVEISLSEPITKTSSSYSKQDNTELRNEKFIDASLIPMSLAKGAEKEAANQSSRKISMSEQICASDQNSASSKSQEDDPSEEVEKSSNICIKNTGKATQHNLMDFLNASSNFISVKNHNEHILQDTFDNLREKKNELVKNTCCFVPSKKSMEAGKNDSCVEISPSEPITKTSSSYSKQDNTELRNEKFIDASLIPMSLAKGAEKEAANQSSRKISMSEQICASDQNSASSKSQEDDPSEEVEKSSNICIKNTGKATQHNLMNFLNVSSNFISVKNHNEHILQDTFDSLREEKNELVKNTCFFVPSKKSGEAGKNDSCVEISPSEPITKTSSSYSKQDNTELRNEKCIDASLIPMSLANGAEKEAANQASGKISISEQICESDQNSVSSKSQEIDLSKEVGKSSNIHIKNIGRAIQHNLNVGSNFIPARNDDEHNSRDKLTTSGVEKNQDEHEFPSPKCKKKALSESIIKPLVSRSMETWNYNNSCNENVVKGNKIPIPEHSTLENNKHSPAQTKLLCDDVENGSGKIFGNLPDEVARDFLQCPSNNGHTFHAVPKQPSTEVGVYCNRITDNGNQDLKNIGRKNMIMSQHTVLQKQELNTTDKVLCPIGGKVKEITLESSMEEVNDFVQHSVCDGLSLHTTPKQILTELQASCSDFIGNENQSCKDIKSRKVATPGYTMLQELKMSSSEEELVLQDDGGKKEIIPESLSELYNFVEHYVCNGISLFTISEDPVTEPEIPYNDLINNENENHKGIINKASMSEDAILPVEKQATIKKMLVYQDNEKLNSIPSKNSAGGNFSVIALHSSDHEPKLCSLPESSLIEPQESCEINKNNQQKSLIAFKDVDKAQCHSFYANSAASPKNSAKKSRPEMDGISSIFLDKTSCGDQKNPLVSSFPKVVPNKLSEYEDEIREDDEEYGCFVYRRSLNGLICMTVCESSYQSESCNATDITSKERFSSDEEILPSTNVQSANEGDDLSDVTWSSCESDLAISSVYSISNFLSNDKVQKNLDVDTYPNKSSNDSEISSSQMLNCHLSVFNNTSEHLMPISTSVITSGINFDESNNGSDKMSTIVTAELEVDTFMLQNLVDFSNEPNSSNLSGQEKSKIVENESCTVETLHLNNESTGSFPITTSSCNTKDLINQDSAVIIESQNFNSENETIAIKPGRSGAKFVSNTTQDSREFLPSVKILGSSEPFIENISGKDCINKDIGFVSDDKQIFKSRNEEETIELQLSGMKDDKNSLQDCRKSLPANITFTSANPLHKNSSNKDFVDQNGSISDSSINLNSGNETRDRGSYASRVCDDPNIKLIPCVDLICNTMASNAVSSNKNSFDAKFVNQNTISLMDGGQVFYSGNKAREKVMCVSRLNDDPDITLVPEASLPTIMIPCSSHKSSCDFVNQDTNYVTGYKKRCNQEDGVSDREPNVSIAHDHTYVNIPRFHEAKVNALSKSKFDDLCHLSSVTPANDVRCSPPKNGKSQVPSSLPAKGKPSSFMGIKNKEKNQVFEEQAEDEEVEIIREVLVKTVMKNRESNQVLQKQTEDEDVQIIQDFGTFFRNNKSPPSAKGHKMPVENIDLRGNFKCLEPSCICCQHLETKCEFIMYNTGVVSKINCHITCKTTNVIFIAECASCESQYFYFSDVTLEQCLKRILEDISNKQHGENEEDCVKHFKQEGHKGELKIYGIDANIRSKDELEKRRNFWLSFLYPVQID